MLVSRFVCLVMGNLQKKRKKGLPCRVKAMTGHFGPQVGLIGDVYFDEFRFKVEIANDANRHDNDFRFCYCLCFISLYLQGMCDEGQRKAP